MLQGGIAAATLVASPAYLRKTVAAQSGPIKIGLPTVVTGGYAELGSHVVRTAKLVKEMVNKNGGLLGRPIEFEIEDTQGDPAACVRKTQELVERKGCHLISGVVVSSEARAIMPKLKEWNAVFVSHGNGDGRLTTPQLLVPNFFRANVSAPMGARALALYLKDDPAKEYIAVGSDYAWGQSSVKAFGEQIEKLGKKLVDRVMTPVGNKDFCDLHHEGHAVGRQGLLRRPAGRRSTRLLLAGRAVWAFETRAALHRDRGPVEYQGARQIRGRPGRRLAVCLHTGYA